MKNQNDDYRRKYEGVIYEASSSSRRNAGERPYPNRAYNGGRTYRRRSAKKSNFALYYVFMLFTGIMVCIVVFTIFFSNLSTSLGNGKLVSAPTPSPAPTEIVVAEMKQVIGVIDEIDIRTGSLSLFEVSNGNSHSLYYDSSTALSNKFGQTAVFSEFAAGDMVDANFNPKTSRLKSLSLSAQTWEFKQIKNVDVNPNQQTVTIGNDIYEYDDGLVVVYDKNPYPVHSVSLSDLVTVRGYRNKVYSISVIKSHGSIEIINKQYIKNGFIEVDTNIFRSLDTADYIELQEGSHRIVVKGDNIEPFIKEIELGSKENIRINLEEAEYKTGVLFITANVDGYVTVIDDRQVSSDEAVTLSYGTHTLRLEKTDYDVWQRDIVVSTPRVDINAVLTPTVKMGRMVIDTNPTGAQLYVDGQLMGVTPYDGSFEQGVREVTLRLSGYNDRKELIDVTDSLPPYIFEMFVATVNYDPNVIETPSE